MTMKPRVLSLIITRISAYIPAADLRNRIHGLKKTEKLHVKSGDTIVN